MSEPLLIVVAAPSGGGKSTVLARVFAEVPRLLFSISHSTRAPRKGEQNGREYFFVTQDEFKAMAARDAFLEWAEVHGNLYGTSRTEIERARSMGHDLVLDIDVQGAEQVLRSHPSALTVFLKPPSIEVLKARLRGRGTDSAQALAVRIANAEREVARCSEFRYVVVNDELGDTVRQVREIIEAERASSVKGQTPGSAILRD
ncbi:MAG: guanylate kinase [Vicinamibacteria bacterium]|nr:guanylate kinase [Vicinamibacteria bacterium]